MRHRHRQPGCNCPGGAGAPRTLAFITILLLFQAGCIPHYSDFVGAQDSRGGDAGTTDERSGDGGAESSVENEVSQDVEKAGDVVPDADALDALDGHADTNDGKDTQDVPDVESPTCGDGECNGTESCDSCLADCGDCCGNQACDYGETCDTCPADCGGPCCGQGGCQGQFGEDKCTCPEDCGDPCEVAECGDDGCDGSCGECASLYGEQYVCDSGECTCMPSCAGKECGPDGCDGTCGSCQAPTVCANGVCIGCGDGECGAGEHNCNCPVDCTGGCAGCCSGPECKTGDKLSFCGSGGETCDVCTGGEECQDWTCVCTPQHHKGCSGGKLYWYDSCDVQGIEEDDCGDGNFCTTDGCSGSQCTHSNKGNDTPCGNDMSCQGGVCEYYCGDGLCADAGGGEDCVTCESDCGTCPGQCDPSCDPTLEKCVEATTGGWVCASKMVEVPAGSFWMGCNNCAGSTVKDTSCGDNEHPYHEVHLDAYEIDRTEVTAAQYLACKNAGGCSAAGSGSYATYEVPGKEDHPVNYVNWSQAEDYCQWVGKELCTEAQWEKGARGGCEKNGGPSNCKAQSRKYPWGNETPICDLAVKSGCDGDTQPVCSRSPAGDSPYGLCDMAGNVWEWTADWYQKDYYCDGDGATGDAYCTECSSWPGSPNAWIKPFCTISGSYRVTRGGGFVSNVGNLRVSSRNVGSPSGDGNLGARCCRSE